MRENATGFFFKFPFLPFFREALGYVGKFFVVLAWIVERKWKKKKLGKTLSSRVGGKRHLLLVFGIVVCKQTGKKSRWVFIFFFTVLYRVGLRLLVHRVVRNHSLGCALNVLDEFVLF